MKKAGFILFVLLCIAQITVPFGMIVDTEQILSEGTMFRFKTEPVDPYDPFRGKYITLTYEADEFRITEDSTWQRGEDIYVLLKKDAAGYVVIKSISREKPEDSNEEYVVAKTSYVYDKKVFIEYPFDRFYMQETQVEEAEKIYRHANITDSLQEQCYALVYVSNGKAIVKDVMIGNKSIQVLVDRKPKR